MSIKLKCMKSIFFLLQFSLALLFFGCNISSEKKTQKPIDTTLQNKHKWIKEYALCSCIKFSYPADTVIANDISFGIYRDISDYGNNSIYRTIDSVSKKIAFGIKPSQISDYNKKKPSLQGCIEYYKSKKLDSIVKSFDNIIDSK
jgi:hypothetical protein